MKNLYALERAQDLHAHRLPLDTIDWMLRGLATKQERREIIASLTPTVAVAA